MNEVDVIELGEGTEKAFLGGWLSCISRIGLDLGRLVAAATSRGSTPRGSTPNPIVSKLVLLKR